MTYRQSCGSRWGLSLHAEAGEPPCGTCLAADDARALAHEARQPLPAQPSGPIADLQRVIAILAEAMAEHDRRSNAKRRNAQRVDNSGDPRAQPDESSTNPGDGNGRNGSLMTTRPGEAA